jgi:hypothetical protein
VRKARRQNPRSPWIFSHFSEFVFWPEPFVASGAAKLAQKDPRR